MSEDPDFNLNGGSWLAWFKDKKLPKPTERHFHGKRCFQNLANTNWFAYFLDINGSALPNDEGNSNLMLSRDRERGASWKVNSEDKKFEFEWDNKTQVHHTFTIQQLENVPNFKDRYLDIGNVDSGEVILSPRKSAGTLWVLFELGDYNGFKSTIVVNAAKAGRRYFLNITRDGTLTVGDSPENGTNWHLSENDADISKLPQPVA